MIDVEFAVSAYEVDGVKSAGIPPKVAVTMGSPGLVRFALGGRSFAVDSHELTAVLRAIEALRLSR